MQIKVEWSQALKFVGQSSKGHQVLMDGNGGTEGASPMELVLMAIAGCSSVDIVSDLKDAKQKIQGCEVDVKAERVESAPKVFRKIDLLYTVTGTDVDARLVEKAINASMNKYCSVAKMLEATVQINACFEVKAV
ncbi:OsmC family protein [Motilimonas cestriensis]|uniref:OsmC family protein n=1 Tax=Motilimonas cestriensis TaxID=2742685 RepID=A0ABS8WCK2_9GAMM|nr:OsmC family protein [Motilimonas cestriensis]MCE2595070.1 OsmC family protein [Motilimonas cestriensis]